MNLALLTELLSSTIRITTPIMLMALGGMLCERANVFNIALEGMALVGAFFAVAFVSFTGGRAFWAASWQAASTLPSLLW